MSNDLYLAALQAMAKSHSPYSRFPVGAAIRSGTGTIYAGCNIENASFPEGWCAETSAIAHMIMGGDTAITEIAVVAKRKPLITPCGGCRQRIAEFADPRTVVHLCGTNGIEQSVSLGDLLPKAFGQEAL